MADRGPIKRMCVGCPFRSEETRAELLKYIVENPDEMWPCHESAEFNDLSPDDCQGRVIFGEHIKRIRDVVVRD